MNTQSYLDIATQIRAEVPVCKSIDIFNNQLDEPEKHQPLNMPCVLIEWLPTDWETMGAGVQDGTGGFRIHCITNSMRSTYNLDTKTLEQQALSLQHLLFQKDVHAALQGFAPCGYSELQRKRTIPEQRYTSVIDIIHEYTANEVDESAGQHLITTHVVQDFPVTGKKITPQAQ